MTFQRQGEEAPFHQQVFKRQLKRLEGKVAERVDETIGNIA